MLMNNNTLIANSIRKALSEQRELMADLEKQADEVNATIETHRIMIEGLEKSLDQYQSINPAGNDSIPESPALTIENSQHVSLIPTLCKEYTLQILKESDAPLHSNEIAAIYEKRKIASTSTSSTGKLIRLHLKELEKEGLAYLTNPDAQRSMRYAPVKDKQ